MSGCTCEWGQYTSGECDPETCDYRDLPYEKEAIIARLRKERETVESIKSQILGADDLSKFSDKEVERLMDITVGMTTMVERLKADFDMFEDEIEKAIGVKKTPLSQRAKLAMKLVKMKNKRRKK